MTYRVVRSDLTQDRGEIIALWKRHLPLLPYPERHLDWAYVNNPFSRGLIWRLTADGCTVGVAGLVIRRFKVGDSVVLAGRLGGFAVDPEHRSLGPALMLERAVLEECGRNGLAAIYTSSPPHLVRMSSRAGYRPVVTLTRHVRVLDAEPFLRRRLGSAAAARWLSWPSNIALRVAAGLDWRPGVVTELDRFDDRCDDLWTRAAPHYGVTTERTSRFLRWRFRDYPVDLSFVTIGVTNPADGRLLGYGIYFMDDNVATVVDLFAEDTHSALPLVVAGITRWLRGRGATSISVTCAGTGVLGLVLRRHGFRPRPDDHPHTIMVSPPEAGAASPDLVSGPRWHFLAADDFWH